MLELKGDKFAVTGAAGFIGSHIAEELVNQGKEVICIDNYATGNQENLKPWWDDRLCTMMAKPIQTIKAADLEGVDTVFNNAAAKATYCFEHPERDLMVNALGNFRVFDAAREAGVRKVVHASTGSVYGDDYEDGRYTLTKEDSHLIPKSFYGVSKLAGEAYLRAFREYYPEFQYVILRYYHVFGPRQDASPYGGVIPIFIRRALEGKPLVINGDGEQVRFFTWVKDVVKANFIVAESKVANHEAFNVAGSEPVTISELAEIIKGTMGHLHDCKVEIEYAPARPGDIKFFNVSCAKIAGIRGRPETGFGEGLSMTINWYVEQFGGKDHGSRRAQTKPDVQDTESEQTRPGQPRQDLPRRQDIRPSDYEGGW